MVVAPKIACLSLLATATTAIAALPAAEVIPFEGVSLEGGGEVIIRPGARHGYRILRGSAAALEITSERNRGLRIRCRPNACHNYTPQIEVSAPRVTALAINGGGSMRIHRGYAPQGAVAISVHGGGLIDTRALDVTDVAASVTGGGTVLTNARSSLAASVRGGGSIIYSGGARHVATSIHGGGSVRQAGQGG